MKHYINLISLTIILALCLQGVAFAQKSFNQFNLFVKGKDLNYMVEDLNQDGFNDLLMFHAETSGTEVDRYFSIFYQTANGFDSIANQRIKIDSNAVIFDCAEIGHQNGKVILIFKHDGVFYYEPKEGSYDSAPRLLIQTDSMFQLADRSFLEHMDFTRDFNQDGLDEIIVPVIHLILTLIFR